jgi:hypothetical protein
MRHECAVPGCGKPIVAGLLMCKPHWYQVSPRTRAWVKRSWDTVQLCTPNTTRYLGALQFYRSAKAAAIAEVEERNQLQAKEEQ